MKGTSVGEGSAGSGDKDERLGWDVVCPRGQLIQAANQELCARVRVHDTVVKTQTQHMRSQ